MLIFYGRIAPASFELDLEDKTGNVLFKLKEGIIETDLRSTTQNENYPDSRKRMYLRFCCI